LVARPHFVGMDRDELQPRFEEGLRPTGGVRGGLLFMLLVAVFWLGGCASKDPDDISARPWNSPRGWESGLPPGMFERR
jgi:hypothetical protein